MRNITTLPLLLLVGAMAGCGSSGSTATGPTPVLAQFTDPTTSVQTPNVRDVQDQTVQFDISSNSLIWMLTNQRFTGYTVSGNFINGKFQVRFGTKNGTRAAYFTEAATGTLCDIEIVNGQVVINPTDVPVPGTQPPQLAIFTNPDSAFMTSDVRDVQGQIVQFDTNNAVLIWKADGRSFPGFTVTGNFVNGTFQVRFGMEGGEPRAYFTETARPFLCDIEIVNGQVVITATNVPVPGGS